jgi:hypothetical protein
MTELQISRIYHCCVSDGGRSFLVALIVCTILNLINQGNLDLTRIILTFALPYCVATYGTVSYQLNKAQNSGSDSDRTSWFGSVYLKRLQGGLLIAHQLLAVSQSPRPAVRSLTICQRQSWASLREFPSRSASRTSRACQRGRPSVRRSQTPHALVSAR